MMIPCRLRFESALNQLCLQALSGPNKLATSFYNSTPVGNSEPENPKPLYVDGTIALSLLEIDIGALNNEKN